MRTEIIFKDIRRSEYIENFITDKVETLTDKLINSDSDLHVIVRICRDRQKTETRHPFFHCEVTVTSGANSRPTVISKADRNVFRAIVACFDSFKVILSKSHDRLYHDRRRHRGLANLTPLETTELDAIPSPVSST